MSEWISLTKRRPNPNERVLISNGKIVTEAFMTREIFTYWDLVNKDTKKARKEINEYFNPYNDCWDATHWMPLPEPPK